MKHVTHNLNGRGGLKAARRFVRSGVFLVLEVATGTTLTTTSTGTGTSTGSV
ncbi:MAG: hypothetical protein RLN89_14825 [Parvibaculum sp.]